MPHYVETQKNLRNIFFSVKVPIFLGIVYSMLYVDTQKNLRNIFFSVKVPFFLCIVYSMLPPPPTHTPQSPPPLLTFPPHLARHVCHPSLLLYLSTIFLICTCTILICTYCFIGLYVCTIAGLFPLLPAMNSDGVPELIVLIFLAALRQKLAIF